MSFKIHHPYALFICLFLIGLAFAEVEPPNYDFSLDTFKDFHPGANINDIEKKYGKREYVKKIDSNTIYKFYVSHIRYKFPVFVRMNGNAVIDMHARLPNYFIHDVFLASLVNRYGQQNKFKKIEEGALYVWNNTKGLAITYYGTCTIQCLPIYVDIAMGSNSAANQVDQKNKADTPKSLGQYLIGLERN